MNTFCPMGHNIAFHESQTEAVIRMITEWNNRRDTPPDTTIPEVFCPTCTRSWPKEKCRVDSS